MKTFLFVLALLLTFGCCQVLTPQTRYVCPDGSVQANLSECSHFQPQNNSSANASAVVGLSNASDLISGMATSQADISGLKDEWK